MSLTNLNNHIELYTWGLEMEGQALLATTAGDYGQADQCDRQIEQITVQIDELSKSLDDGNGIDEYETGLKGKVFCPDRRAAMEVRIHQQMFKPFESSLHFYSPGRCHVEDGIRKGFDPAQIPGGSPKFYVPLAYGLVDLVQVIDRVADNMEVYSGTPEVHETDKKDIQELRRELSGKTAAIESAVLELDKAITVLNHWMDAYLYFEKPDPKAAMDWGSRAGRGPHYDQSAQWYMEYNKITKFINIASDYVYNSKEILAGILKEA